MVPPAGNIQGRLSYKGKDKEEKRKHVLKRTAIGALGVGALGAGGGHVGLGKAHDYVQEHNPVKYENLLRKHMNMKNRR